MGRQHPNVTTPRAGSPVFIACHTRTGVAALNVISAALDADARTEGADVRFARDVKHLAALINEVRAQGAIALVAWSFYSTDFASAVADLARVRACSPRDGVVHFAGGVHATAEPLTTLQAGFDMVCVGEGEATLVEVFDCLARGHDPRVLAGIAYLDDAGRLVSHGPGPRTALDRWPGMNLRHGRWNPLEITRGCVYACSFCQTPYVFKARFRHRSVNDVRAHAEAMARGGAKFIRFVTPTCFSYGSDDTSVNLDAVAALLSKVREAMGAEAKVYFGTFPSECRPEHITEASLALIKRWCDNDSVIIGGQSGSERVLDATRRGHTVDDVIIAVERCIVAGIRPDVDLLYGLPGETPDDQRATVVLAERLVAMGARIHSHAFMPLPGTPLRDAEPSPIGDALVAMLHRTEARGQAYGPWRGHVVRAQELVRRRRG